jgi:hypothetical protein
MKILTPKEMTKMIGETRQPVSREEFRKGVTAGIMLGLSKPSQPTTPSVPALKKDG